MDKRGYEHDDAEDHLPEPKKRRLPALARFGSYTSTHFSIGLGFSV